MIRRVQMNISYGNEGKLKTLDKIMSESQRVVNLYIDAIWEMKDFSSKFVTFKVDTWLTARMQQVLGKQALEIVKSQRKKRRKTKPVFNRLVFNLDSKVVNISFDQNTEVFDTWFKMWCIGDKIDLKLPSKKHKHFHGFENWELKKSMRLRKVNNNYFIDLYFEHDDVTPTKTGKTIGLDCGYKKLLISSENIIYDTGLESVYEKIARKKHKSTRFKKSLIERDNKINESINQLKFNELKTVVVEDLKNVKKGSKGKIRKSFNNKLQRWSYLKVLNGLESKCETNGIKLVRVDPAYTSQTCSKCGFVDKASRKGEKFCCTKCSFSTDADFNASVNILHRGVYSPATTQNTNLEEFHIFQ